MDPLLQPNSIFPLLSLPLDVLKLIFDRLGTRALFRLAQTNRVLFELVIPHLYKDFRCTVRRRKDDLDERLTSALDTLTSHTNNYASHVRDFAIAGEWFRSYATADAEYAKKGKLSPGVLMLNSLVKLAMLKMPNLDSFAWDIRDIPLNKGLVNLLQQMPNLRNLRFRLAERLHPNLRAAGLEPSFSGFKNIRILTIMLIETLEQLKQVGDIVANSPEMVGIKVALKPSIPGAENVDLSKILFRGRPAIKSRSTELANIAPPDESFGGSPSYNMGEPQGDFSENEGGLANMGSALSDSYTEDQKHQFVSLKLYRVMFPASSNHLSNVIDFSKLVRLSLWQCGTHPAFWKSLASSTSALVPRLQCIITDDAIPELAEFLGSFSGLQEFYLVHSSGAMTLDALTNGLSRHTDCLRCLAVYHLDPEGLVFNRKALRLFLKRCTRLREVALSVADADWSYFLNVLHFLPTIVALHVLLEDSPTSEHIAGTLGSLMAIAVGPLQDLEYVVVNDKYFKVEGSAGDMDAEESNEWESEYMEHDQSLDLSVSPDQYHLGGGGRSMLPEGNLLMGSDEMMSGPQSLGYPLDGLYPSMPGFSQTKEVRRPKRPERKRRAVKYVDLDPDHIDNINIFTVLRTTRR